MSSKHPSASSLPLSSLRQLEGLPDRQRRLLLRAGLGLSLGGASLLTACGGGDNNDGGSGPDAGGGTPAGTPAQVSSFALAVLPDTQFYSRYATTDENLQFQRKYGSTPYVAQTKWIADNAAALRIPFTIHLGDVVDQQGKPLQWQVADSAMKVLESAKMPYSILAGNHDVISDVDYVDASSQSANTDAQRNLAKEPYLQAFPTTRAQQQSTFGGRDPSGFHEYHVVNVDGNAFMVLSMSWRASDAAIAWARGVLAKHPTLPTILATHQLLNIAADGVSPLEVPYGLMLWDKLIRDNDQIFMTLNGHYHGGAHLTKTNDFGNAVEEMVVDYQMAYMGGNGLMRLYEFDLTNNKIKVMSFSPWVTQKPTDTLNEFDVAVLSDANHQFEISIDFKKRFARFNPNFAQPAAGNAPINERAKAALLTHFTEPAPSVKKAAADPSDYPVVASTVAHWRFFGGTEGGVVPVGQVIQDETGANPIARQPLAQGGAAQEGDLTWSSDHHYLSAAPGSVRFSNSVNSPLRMSAFATDVTAPLNGLSFSAGSLLQGPDGAPMPDLVLEPFFRVHDSRYVLYWPCSTPAEAKARRERLALEERERLALQARTVDAVAPGEQQPESDHGFAGEGIETGLNKGHRWRHATAWFSYRLNDPKREGRLLRLAFSALDDGRRFSVWVNDRRLADLTLRADEATDRAPGAEIYSRDFPLPEDWPRAADGAVRVRLVAEPGSIAGGIYDLRLLRATAPAH
ncbi:modulator protein [Mitsuaria sp. TWR114]|uniref:DUF6805 domain-containing protein n=1 Tax=Mitsuaria sp. TWR114 TaxID=2601731 RepID=UPI0011BDBA91|nr:DUF6805 domain-containing protein [Mitsuaria sp. TWR114]TXD94958.1 modulator protein [Mitsuaria sp. TWR114]